MKKKNLRSISILLSILLCLSLLGCGEQNQTKETIEQETVEGNTVEVEKDAAAEKYYNDDKTSFNIKDYIDYRGTFVGINEEYVTFEINGWGILMTVSTNGNNIDNCELSVMYGDNIQGYHESFIINKSCYDITDNQTSISLDSNLGIYYDSRLLEDLLVIAPILESTEATEKCPLCGTGIQHINDGVIKL